MSSKNSIVYITQYMDESQIQGGILLFVQENIPQDL